MTNKRFYIMYARSAKGQCDKLYTSSCKIRDKRRQKVILPCQYVFLTISIN